MASKQAAQVVGPMRIMHPEPVDPQPSPQVSLQGHLRSVAATKINPPAQWQEIKNRLDELSAAVGARPMLQRLSDAVVNGDGDIASLLAAASTETLQNRAGVVETVHADTLAALRAAYEPVAHKNYTMLAGRFDNTAKRFVTLARGVDVDASADVVVSDRKRLEAWEQAPVLAAELDAMLPALDAACLLARRIDQPWKLGADESTLTIPLCLDGLDRAHPRQVWLAWHEQIETQPTTADPTMMLSNLTRPPLERVQHRCGRWGALLKVPGLTISAHPNPVELQLFTPPANRVLVHTEPSSGRKTSPRIVDPCDQQSESRSRLRRLVGALSGRRTAGEETDILQTFAGTTD